MGFGDWVKNRVNDASKIATSVTDKVQQGAESLQKTVSEGVSEVKKTTTEVATDLINQAESGVRQVNNSIQETKKDIQHAVTHPFETINNAADQLGDSVRGAGKAIEIGGRQLSQHVPFGDEIVQLGRNAQQLGQGIKDAPENAVETADQVQNEIVQLGREGQKLLDRADKAIDRGIEAARSGLDTLKSGVDSLVNAGKGFVDHVADSVNYDKQIDQLGNGDKYTLGVGGAGSVEGVKLYGKGKIEVERKGDKYVVSADGELGGGLYAEVGGKLGPLKASGSAEALLGAGGKVEMTFDNPADAKKATEILLKMAKASGAGAAASSVGNTVLPGVGSLAGQAVAHSMKPSDAEMQFLGRNVNAVELKGNTAAGLAGTLGAANKQTQIGGLFLKGGVKEEHTARIEFPKGKPPSISIKTTYEGEVAAGGGLGLGAVNAKGDVDNSGSLGTGASASIKGKIETEEKYTLPTGITSDQILQNPLGTINNAANQIQRSREGKLSVTLDGNANVAGNGRGFEAKLEFSGNLDQIEKSGALQQALGGDFNGALRSVGDKVKVEGSIKPYQKGGFALNPGVSVMGFGIEAEIEATRQDFADQPTWQYGDSKNPKTGTDAANDVNRELQRMMRFIQQNPEVLQVGNLRSQYPIHG